MPRQAKLIILISTLLFGLFACSPSPQPIATSTFVPPTSTSTPIPPTITPTPTVTPLACLTQPGRVGSGSLDTTNPPQQYLIYLPPCYDQRTDLRYPVLYLLHGQTYIDDQWVRLGVPEIADKLILSGQAIPFIIVFPDDRYWNLVAGPGFGDRLINYLIPYIDQTYRTLADRQHRALGGLSRGGGWTVELGFKDWQLFGELGLHSPAIFTEDAPYVANWIAAIPPASWPRLWIDIGDHDSELGPTRQFENILAGMEFPHEFHLFSGDHTENYWSQHVEEYLRWYVQGWLPQDKNTPQP